MKELNAKKFFKTTLYYTPVAIVFMLLFINSISLLYPVVWGVMASFKDVVEYTVFPNKIPTEWHFENYANVFLSLRIQILTSEGLRTVYIEEMLIYTVLWAVFSPVPSTIVTVLMAYVIAKYPNPFTKFIYNLGIVLMCLVVVGTFPAQMQIYEKLHIRNSMFGMIMVNFQGGFSGFNFLLYHSTFKGIPNDYGDAARIDGAGHWSVLWNVYIPFIFNTALVFYILSFVSAWNDYNTFLIWLPTTPSLSYGMYIFQNEAVMYGATWPEVLAGFFLVAIPSAVVYLVLDKRLVSTLRVTGLKG